WHDMIKGKGASRCAMRRLPGGQPLLDLYDPVIEPLFRSRIERREGTDDTGGALGDDEFWARDDEHGRADDGQPQSSLHHRGNRHLPWLLVWRAETVAS